MGPRLMSSTTNLPSLAEGVARSHRLRVCCHGSETRPATCVDVEFPLFRESRRTFHKTLGVDDADVGSAGRGLALLKALNR